MNTTLRQAEALARDVRALVESAKIAGLATVALFPPYPYLLPLMRVLDGSTIETGAQNVSAEDKGAFTGEVSPAMLAELCKWVIIGHSERRQLFGETDELVNKKVVTALRHGLKPILCIGETWEQRNAGKANDVVRAQLEHALRGVPSLKGITIAYEPAWAIGTGMAATPHAAAEVMGGIIARTLTKLHGAQQANDTPLLYGGSVTPDNAEGFASEPSIHGALVGGASLNAQEFVQIVQAFLKAKETS